MKGDANGLLFSYSTAVEPYIPMGTDQSRTPINCKGGFTTASYSDIRKKSHCNDRSLRQEKEYEKHWTGYKNRHLTEFLEFRFTQGLN